MFVLFVTPYFTENALRFVRALLDVDGVRLGVISQERQEVLDPALRGRFAGHWRVYDILDADQLLWAATELANRHGHPHRILNANEQVQVPLAHVRERMGVPGMNVETSRNFRDKARMKDLFRSSGVPCARHACATNHDEAWDFICEVGFPVCVKPVDGAAAQATYRVENAKAFREVLTASGPNPARPLQIEEFVTGQEHSLETISIGGRHLWHSLTRYLPTPLDAMQNPWIQWRVVLPREVDSTAYDDIKEVGQRALSCLGMGTGLSHLEWFRRSNGTLAVNEVGARPPGAQIVTLVNRAHDVDLYDGWCRLMLFDEFRPPRQRKYAAGIAFLRGLGGGRVKEVHGLREVLHELEDVVTDVKAPEYGQAAATSYEGEGYVIVRHPRTRTVEQALLRIVESVRVEMVH
ncbi:MAG: ATP-grasp domain-containing protein [Candidatus Eremiobacterota bacterium]